MRKFLLFAFFSVLLISACSTQVDTEQIAAIVAATLQASSPTQAPTATTSNLEGLAGTVEGTVCYPAEGIPPMNLFFLLDGTGQVTVIPIAQNQSAYSTQLPAGTYTAFAWLPDYSIGGSYSQAVPCGLSVECTDHSLIEFSVTGGSTTSGIDVCDWYGGEGAVPLPQGVEVPAPSTGSIAGSLSYPSEFIPALQIVAFNVNDTNQWFSLSTAENTNTYQFDGLPAGAYIVVAYVNGGDYGGGYTQAVPCGLRVECTDHNLIPVMVSGGKVTEGIDPGDWYAPDGTFPDNPN